MNVAPLTKLPSPKKYLFYNFILQ